MFFFVVFFFTITGLAIILGNGLYFRLSPAQNIIAQSTQIKMRFRKNIELSDIPNNLFTIGSANSSPEYLICGDSHAMALLPLFEKLSIEYEVCGESCARAGTPLGKGIFSEYLVTNQNRGEFFAEFNSAIIRNIKTKKYKKIFLIAKWSWIFESELSENRITNFIDNIKDDHNEVIFVIDVPEFNFEVPKYMRFYLQNNINPENLGIPAPECYAMNKFPKDFIKKIRQKNIKVVDPIKKFVSSNKKHLFLPWDDNGCFYHDRDHLTPYAAYKLEDIFTPFFCASSPSSE